MTGERWVLKRALTGATLHTEAPVSVVSAPTRGLNGAGSLRFTLPSALAGQRADVDGQPVVQEWDTRVYRVLDNGEVAWGGIVISAKDGPSEWVIEASTDSTVLFGTPYLGAALYLAQTDPADIVRVLVEHVQSQPDGDLGIVVTGKTNVRTGSYSTQQAKDATDAYNAAVKTYNAATAERKRRAAIVSDSRKTYSGLVQQSEAANTELSAAKRSKNQARIAAAQAAVNSIKAQKDQQNAVIDAQQRDVDAQAKVVASAKGDKDRAYAQKVAANRAKKEDGGAFELLWWEAPDCGDVLQRLADDTPFDYVDEWKMTGDAITSSIHVYYPRAGRKRDDLAFEQGVNIVDVVEATVPGDDYASEVVGIGAGEGAGSIRRSTAKRNGRLRRVAVVTDKDVKTRASLDRRINRELASRLNVLEVQQLRVRRRPDEAWQLGDDVPVRVTLRGHGDVDLLHRIVEVSDESDNTALLTLRRSDSFIYGG